MCKYGVDILIHSILSISIQPKSKYLCLMYHVTINISIYCSISSVKCVELLYNNMSADLKNGEILPYIIMSTNCPLHCDYIFLRKGICGLPSYYSQDVFNKWLNYSRKSYSYPAVLYFYAKDINIIGYS